MCIACQRVKRVYRINIETCQACDGAVRIIASIEGAVVIRKTLAQPGRRSWTVRYCNCPGRSHHRSGGLVLHSWGSPAQAGFSAGMTGGQDRLRTDWSVVWWQGRRKSVAGCHERLAGGWIAGIQRQGYRCDGRFPDGFSRNPRILLPTLDNNRRRARPGGAYTGATRTWHDVFRKTRLVYDMKMVQASGCDDGGPVCAARSRMDYRLLTSRPARMKCLPGGSGGYNPSEPEFRAGSSGAY